jgi:hypothetical protein
MNRDEIRQKIKETPLKQEELFIEEWNCKILVKELSAKSYLEVVEKGNEKQIIPFLIINSVYTEDGERLFLNKDIDLVLELQPKILNKMLICINALNGLDAKN